MYRILPVVGDVGIGILVAVFFSDAYNNVHIGYVLWGIFWALIPDSDAVIEYVKYGEVAAHKGHTHDHRELFHKPTLLLVPLWYLGEYYGLLWEIAFWSVLFHFIHDSIFTGWGVAWLWPLPCRVKFFVAYDNTVSFSWNNAMRVWWRHELPTAISQYGDPDWIAHTYQELTIPLVVEYTVFVYALFVLVFYLSA